MEVRILGKIKKSNLIATVTLLGYALISLFPILWFISMSIKPEEIVNAYPPKLVFTPTLDNFLEVFGLGPSGLRSAFLQNLWNSLTICFMSTILVLLVSAPAAYSLIRYGLRGGESMAYWVLSTRMIPPIIVIVPLFLTIRYLGLFDTHFGIGLVYTCFQMSFAVWLLRGVFVSIPPEIEEAALLDGCSRLGALVRIVLPLAWSGIAATAIFCFIMSWNDFVIASILSSNKAVTAPVYVASKVNFYAIEWGRLMAAGAVTIVFPLTFAILIQKYIIKGLTFGYA